MTVVFCKPGCTCGRHKVSAETRKKRSEAMKGRPKSRAHRKKISESRRRTDERNLKYLEDHPLTERQCRSCKKIKPIEDFVRRTRIDVKGQRRYYWSTSCRICVNAQVKARLDSDPKKRERKRATNRRARERLYQDPARLAVKREQQREWAAAKRRENGAKPRNLPRSNGRGPQLETKPLADFIKQTIKDRGVGTNELARKAGLDEAHVRRIVTGKDNQKKTSLDHVDQLLRALDRPEMMVILYPQG